MEVSNIDEELELIHQSTGQTVVKIYVSRLKPHIETLAVPRSEGTTKTIMQSLENAQLRRRSCDARAFRICACTGVRQPCDSTLYIIFKSLSNHTGATTLCRISLMANPTWPMRAQEVCISRGMHFNFLLTPMRGWLDEKLAGLGVFLVQSGRSVIVQQFIYLNLRSDIWILAPQIWVLTLYDWILAPYIWILAPYIWMLAPKSDNRVFLKDIGEDGWVPQDLRRVLSSV